MKNFRIQLFGDGKFYVENKNRVNIFGKTKWECCIYWSGTTEPFGFKTFDDAMKNLLYEIRKETLENSFQFFFQLVGGGSGDVRVKTF